MQKYKSQLKEFDSSFLEKGIDILFKKYSAKEAAGILKISMINALPNEKYLSELMKYLND